MVITCKEQADLDFDGLVAVLRRAFPESATISNDYYADRLTREVGISMEH
jgi:hypothetical protein